MKTITVAVCTYNRSRNLAKLVEELRKQESPIPLDILFVDNNSNDDTKTVLKRLAEQPGAPIRVVTETQQGIPYARNRALRECMDSDFMLFMDDDELPSSPGIVEVAAQALLREDVQCVGGKVSIDFSLGRRPSWLSDELLPFYAEIDYGDEKFVITDASTPIWTSIIAYDMQVFRGDDGLRFDTRYNRAGDAIGGGEDKMMFNAMMERGIKMIYLPEMSVRHFVEPWRMTRCYFWKLHFLSGCKSGRFQMTDYPRALCGIPPFMLKQVLRHLVRSFTAFVKRDNHYVRESMNASHAIGMMYGGYLRWKQQRGRSAVDDL